MKEKKETIYEHLNDYLNTAYHANYRVQCVLEQMRRADQFNVSQITEDWFRSKHDSFAEHRWGIVSANSAGLEKEVEYYDNELIKAKNSLVSEMRRYFADKNFEEVFVEDGIIDPEVYALYEKQANGEIILPDGTGADLGLVERFHAYVKSLGSAKIARSVEKVHDRIVEDVDARGYMHLLSMRNESADVKIIDESFVTELSDFAKLLGPTYKRELVKSQIELNKLLKKFKKDPTNVELASRIDGAEYAIAFCNDVLSRTTYLEFVARILSSRMEAVNSRKYSLSDKIVEGVADFGFMVPSEVKGEENRPKYTTMYMGKTEIENLISTTKEFAEAGNFTQYLSSKLGVPTVLEAHEYELSKLTMEMLKNIHSDNVAALLAKAKETGETVTAQEAKLFATKPEIAKYLQFVTPLGKVWFDGENGIDVETGKVVPFTEICKYVVNPQDGNLYYLKTEETITPGSVTLVNAEPSGNNPDLGKGK